MDDKRESRAVMTFIREDEKQQVFVVQSDGGFRVIETAELWEEPLPDATCYFYYPTSIGGTVHASVEEAVRHARAGCSWIKE